MLITDLKFFESVDSNNYFVRDAYLFLGGAMSWDADRITSLNSDGKSKLFYLLNEAGSKFLRIDTNGYAFGNLTNINVSEPSSVTDGEFRIEKTGSELNSKMLMSQVTNFLLKTGMISATDEIELLQAHKKLKHDLDCHKYHRSLSSRG